MWTIRGSYVVVGLGVSGRLWASSHLLYGLPSTPLYTSVSSVPKALFKVENLRLTKAQAN